MTEKDGEKETQMSTDGPQEVGSERAFSLGGGETETEKVREEQ